MNQLRLLRSFSILILVICSLTGCEESGESNDVEIALFPSSPLVINSEFVIYRADGQPKTITGPWFPISYAITNGATKPLTVVSFVIEVVGRENGIETKKSFQPDFGDYAAERNLVTESPVKPGDTFTESVTWYVDSLPELASFRYSAKITFVGYFVEEDDPDTENDESRQPGARFERTYRFSTR